MSSYEVTTHEAGGPWCSDVSWSTDVHCYSHGVDEDAGSRVFRLCPECNHVYRSKRELRRLYKTGAPDRPWRRYATEGWDPREARPSRPSTFVHWVEYRVRLALIRADRIRFCPLCIHDF